MDEQLKELTLAWAEAEQRGNSDFLARTLADDFVGIGPLGFLLTKEQWIARYESGSLRNESFAIEDVACRFYGDTAVVTGRQIQQTEYRDPSGQVHDTSGKFRATLICVRQSGRWMIAGWQASGPIPDFPPGRG